MSKYGLCPMVWCSARFGAEWTHRWQCWALYTRTGISDKHFLLSEGFVAGLTSPLGV